MGYRSYEEKSSFGRYLQRASELVRGSISKQSEDGLGAFSQANNKLDYVRRRYTAEYKGNCLQQYFLVLLEI